MKQLGTAKSDRKLDLAAHAAWLYYIAGNTQEEIATKLNISRQAAQRLVALAVSEKLIKFRLDHPLSNCITLAEALRDRFALSLCEVVPNSIGKGDPRASLGVCAANHLEAYLGAKTPNITALSSGQTLRAMVEQIPLMERPQHKIVSIIGNMSHYGRAGRHEVVIHLSERTDAQAYPLPTPVVAISVEERKLLQTQRSFLAIESLAKQAKATFIGIGDITWKAPLHENGFINDEEVAELIELGAVGEIAGWAYDQQGDLLKQGTNTRVASVSLEQPVSRLTIAVAGSINKTDAILAALKGKLINGLITDEEVAEAILVSL
ncbi:sugar-binding transcriptional regulator [Myxosarcina sp. GI1]|uniref:sugar-binding transcriptional regulator n=1 Tax=Myxosarcina sp. GI1 TaxID=1541065 RepID=UPI000565C992|nr:sugar-binding transcriptional regulator [Myxosarcina sp. GI1]